MNFTRSSRKSWSLLRRLGAAQRPPSKLHQVAKAPTDKKFEKQIRNTWRQAYRSRTPDDAQVTISAADIQAAHSRVKLGTAPGYDNIDPEFLTHIRGQEK